MQNLRIRNQAQEDGGAWEVRPDNSKTLVPYIKRTLADLQREEPMADWHLETRGDSTLWHRADESEVRA